MKFPALEDDTQTVEVTRVSKNGFWVSLPEEDVYLPFDHFPWFRDAPLGQVLNVQQPTDHNLYWPDLGIDLSLETISYPEPMGLVANDGIWRLAD
ncbi:MAG TPA: DUF2442 domain-containing protein [Nitrospira sp.]|nr:DUF2442 domain-containing protein [Rhodocyclaceae bacterium]HNC85130.1 DUF2442 domain-containing protein [Nitrospira sp.]